MYPDFYTDTGKFYILSRGPSIFLWKKPLPFKFLASALILIRSQQMIERIYSEEVLDFLNRTSSIVDEKGHKLVVRNG